MIIAVTWEMCGYVDIPGAKSIKEAMEIFDKESESIELPRDGEYVDGSFRVTTEDIEEMKAFVR